ncbi:zincin [Eremomyces bilateralis CBS 781.70]|uniref:Mitochondrial intermediate peptidase n=1 Tax=Eremomyces bilateralis CBS 781.70 TaxID=1392243 RepID=A0A6G1FZK2_9PEZI|nr:zincin [Eremomyces bilateralis CBS 781.70]KAF1811295.1 zincin [Eremomyces bilateralis CBS 781.70]
MLKSLQKQSWTCAKCLQRIQTRSASSAAAAVDAARSSIWQPNYSAATTQDDTNLRLIFDSPSFWREFSQKAEEQLRNEHRGLFHNRYLKSPDGFQAFAAVTLKRCSKLVDRVLAASTLEEYKGMARELDRLSDLLCRVIDLADFVRSSHPDRRYQTAASNAYAMMFEYMNQLNTTTGLNEQLKKAWSMPEVRSAWSHEEKVVAEILMRDFAKSAIDLPDDVRRQFVELSSEIAEVGADFVERMSPEMEYIQINTKKLKGLDPVSIKQISSWGKSILPSFGSTTTKALRMVEDPDTRREVYMASRKASPSTIHRLEVLLQKRAQVAQVSGYDSYAHMALSDKMARTPEAVNQFLHALSTSIRPKVREELQSLLELKKSDAHGSTLFPETINAWDRDYYTNRLFSLRSRIPTPDTLTAYFSLGSVMQGLSRIFSRLYGVRLVPREAAPGETWDPSVRRLDVMDENDGHIGVMYCDLFTREGKSPHPAHFTLRCSREIPSTELADLATESPTATPSFSSLVDAATEGMAHSYNPTTHSLHQLPTIALICDFPPPRPSANSNQPPTLLSLRSLLTLYHEMGHAIHSLLGRTSLHNIAGTRCATDFAELPSILFERFATDPAALALWATHWETGEPLDPARIATRLEREKLVQAGEVEMQVVLSALDAGLHGREAAAVLNRGGAFDSTEVYRRVYEEYSSVPEPRGTSYHGFFGHLVGYGATYYAYLFDRAIAAKVWKDVFQKPGLPHGAISREAGERYKNEVLRWGGGRDGWQCVAGVLGRPELSEGGEAGMKEVGRWGIAKDADHYDG